MERTNVGRIDTRVIGTDASIFVGGLQEILTPTELRLKKEIARSREELDTAVYQALRPLDIDREQTRSFVASNLDNMFNNYIEANFPISSNDVEPFFRHAALYARERAERERAYQTAYASNYYKQVRDPRGMSAMAYPEIL
jgi:hypothetical protein